MAAVAREAGIHYSTVSKIIKGGKMNTVMARPGPFFSPCTARVASTLQVGEDPAHPELT
jgi:hypothetical protein